MDSGSPGAATSGPGPTSSAEELLASPTRAANTEVTINPANTARSTAVFNITLLPGTSRRRSSQTVGKPTVSRNSPNCSLGRRDLASPPAGAARGRAVPTSSTPVVGIAEPAGCSYRHQGGGAGAQTVARPRVPFVPRLFLPLPRHGRRDLHVHRHRHPSLDRRRTCHRRAAGHPCRLAP